MCCEELVCAACGGRVSEARCTTCAVSRETVHAGRAPMRPEILGLLALLVVLLALLAG